MPVRAREKRGRELQGLRPTQGILVMLIRIRGTDRGEPFGDLIQYSLQEPVPFRNSKELVFRIAEIGRLLKPGAEDEFHSLGGGRDRNRSGGYGSLGGRDRSGKEKDGYSPSGGSGPGTGQGSSGSGLWNEGGIYRLAAADSRQRADFYLHFSAAGVKEQLCLELVGRHNMSLQGRIRGRLTAGRPVCFRSAMELLVMLSELDL